MNKKEILNYLKNSVELFKKFDDNALEKLVDGSILSSAEKSEAIIEFGQKGTFMGVLMSGSASVSVIDDAGMTKQLAIINEGEIFGEMSLMSGERSVANLVAQTHCRLLKIPEHLFTSSVLVNPGAMAYLVKLLSVRAKELAFHEQNRLLAQRTEVNSSDPHGFTFASTVPHNILIINCGSSSLKYSLFDTEKKGWRVSGLVEKIGIENPRYVINGKSYDIKCADHKEAFVTVINSLTEEGFIKSPEDITAVGHRVVHGGERFSGPTVINDSVLAEIKELSPLAPLHNPVNIQGIELALKTFVNAVHVAVFDTTFHHTMPAYAYLYGLPYKYYKEQGVRRYGFHGISHSYVSLKAAQFLEKPYTSLEMVTCHLGNGASVCAVDHGRSIDTSMGMTPSAGLMMGTRSGDIDPGVIAYITKNENLDGDQIDDLINRESGFLGISGVSSDMRKLIQSAGEGHHRSLLAIKTFCYNLRKYIGAYVAAMQGLDAVIFTGGIGEHSSLVRTLACQGLECMGIEIDDTKNRAADSASKAVDISADSSKIKILVIPADEELMIARDTINAVQTERNSQNTVDISIPVEVSAHHVHLSQKHVEALFGKNHKLTPVADLSQPGQFACAEKVTLEGPKGRVENVRVLGPARKDTQVEIAMTEQFKLGVHPPIRESGDIAGTPGLKIIGKAGELLIDKGVICAMRHIHMSPKDAIMLGVRDRYIVRVVVEGDRKLVFGDVIVRVGSDFLLAMHIDTDEANAADIKNGAIGHIESIQSRV